MILSSSTSKFPLRSAENPRSVCCAPRRCSGRRQGRRLNYAFFSMAPVHWLRCIGKGLDRVLNLIAVLNHAGPSLLPLVQLQQPAVFECVAVQRQLVTRRASSALLSPAKRHVRPFPRSFFLPGKRAGSIRAIFII